MDVGQRGSSHPQWKVVGVIRKEQDWYVAKEKKIRLLNGNELVSVLQLPGEVLSPFLPTEQSAHSFLLAYNYPSTEHWLLNTESLESLFGTWDSQSDKTLERLDRQTPG